MPTKVIMPQLGESVVEGTVSRWLKQPGEQIEEYEPLLEVSTDKVDTEIPAPASGVLVRVYVPAGETVAAGTLLAEIGEAADGPVHSLHNGGKQQAAISTHITPVVARMAAEHQLDLSQIEGSGRGGRITKKDVEAYLEQGPAAEDTPAWERPGSGDLFKSTADYDDDTPTTRIEVPVKAPPKQPQPAAKAPESAPASLPGELVELTPLRRAIAEHMVRSKLETSPHVTTVFEVDLSAVLAHREAHKADYARQGVNLTLTAYFAAASVTALQAHPDLNARWTDDGIYRLRDVHLGIAVAIEGGLIVPVIRHAQDLNLLGMARALNDLAARARARQLRPDEVKDGTFSITNHGVSGSLLATPIINQPQAAILGVGVMEKRVKVIDDAIAIRPCCYITLTFDHRIADGAGADGFMAALKQRLESWG